MSGRTPATKLPFRMKRWMDELKVSQFPDRLAIQVAATSVEEQTVRLGKIFEEMGWVQTGRGTSEVDTEEENLSREVDFWITEERDFELVEGLGEAGRKTLVLAAYLGMIMFVIGLVSLFVFVSRLVSAWDWGLVAITLFGAMLGLLGATIADTGTFDSTLAMIRLEGKISVVPARADLETARGDFTIRIGLGRVRSYNSVSKGSSPGRHSWGLVERNRFRGELAELRSRCQSSLVVSDVQLVSGPVQGKE